MDNIEIRRAVLLTGLALLLALPAGAQQRRVKAKSGDGVTVLLQRHGFAPAQYEAEFRRLNKGKFTADGGLKMGLRYLLPEKERSKGRKAETDPDRKASKGNEPLFGRRYARYQPVSNELSGAVFYLVSGHGGPDPGAIGRYGRHRLHEDEYAYDIVLRLGRELLARGARVHFIIQDAKDGIRDAEVLNNSKRETCMGRAIPLGQVERLNQRCEAINRLYNKEKANYKRALFVHVDSRSRGTQTDVFFYYAAGSSKGQRLARQIHRTFDRKYDKHQPNRGFGGTVSTRDLYVLRNTTPPAVFLELGNIQNPRDQKRLVLSSNRQALARWIAEGIVADYRQ